MGDEGQRWPPGFFVRPPGFFDREENSDSDPDGPNDLNDERVAKGKNDTSNDTGLGYSKKDQTAINLLPSFPEGLGWNEAREKWTTWRPMFLLLELTPSLKTQRAKETVLIAKGNSMVQDIAFRQRPAPDEVTNDIDEEPVFVISTTSR